MGGRPGKGIGYLLFLILICGLVGGVLGEAIGRNVAVLSFLKNSYSIGMPQPLILNLKLATLTFGVNFSINIFSLLGMLIGYLIYKKL